MKDFYSAVFFDMDGLLVDSEPLWLESETELMANFGYTWRTEDQNHCLGGPLSRVGTYMFEKSEKQKSPEYFTASVIDLMSQKLRFGAPVMPGALELLASFEKNKIPTALVSASPRVLVNAVLSTLPGNPFVFSLSADDVEKPKPSPEAYVKAAHNLNVDIHDCLILEDSPTGVQAATSSGAFTIAVPHFVEIAPREKLRVIKTLEELDFQKLQFNYELDKSI